MQSPTTPFTTDFPVRPPQLTVRVALDDITFLRHQPQSEQMHRCWLAQMKRTGQKYLLIEAEGEKKREEKGKLESQSEGLNNALIAEIDSLASVDDGQESDLINALNDGRQWEVYYKWKNEDEGIGNIAYRAADNSVEKGKTTAEENVDVESVLFGNNGSANSIKAINCSHAWSRCDGSNHLGGAGNTHRAKCMSLQSLRPLA